MRRARSVTQSVISHTDPAARWGWGQQWQARARATDGTNFSAWTLSTAVPIGSSAPTAPTTCSVAPASPTTTDDLTASASGSTDPDAGDTVSYEYQWRSSTDGGATWSAWGNDGATLPAAQTAEGQQWQARARATDGTNFSAWTVSAAVTIHGLTITAGPTADPDPVASGGQVQCSVTAEDNLGHALSYEWTAEGGAGSFDDATSASPVWTAPAAACDGQTQYTLTVTITCTDDPTLSVSDTVIITVTPTMNLSLATGWNLATAGSPADAAAAIGDLVGPSVQTAYTWDPGQFRYDLVDLPATTGASLTARGTWLLSDQDANRGIAMHSAEQHVLNVGMGWNLLANPYGCPLDLATGLIAGGGQLIVPAYIWDAQNFTYALTSVIPAGASFWVMSDYNGQATIDPAGMTTATVATTSLANRPETGTDGGSIQLAASAAGTSDRAI